MKQWEEEGTGGVNEGQQFMECRARIGNFLAEIKLSTCKNYRFK